MWDRIARNWKTSSVAITALMTLIAMKVGFVIDSAEAVIIIAGVEAIILLLSKD